MLTVLPTLVLLATLAKDVLALPSRSPVTPKQKRGFRSVVHHRVPDNTLSSRDIGAVYGIYDGAGWVLPVLIGNQQVYLNIDTGSSDIWTTSTFMPGDQQATVTRGVMYDPSKSLTYQEMAGGTFSLGYADGSGASGLVGIDTVNIGGATVPNMPFGMCNDLVYPGGSGTRGTNGPVGLGWGVWNSIRPNPQCTFMECLQPYVPAPIFSTSFKLNDTGFVDWGYYDSAAFKGNMTEIPIFNASTGNEGQWMSLGVKFGSGGTLFDAEPLDLNFDSGTSTLALSADVAAAYWALVEGATNSSGTWMYPCGTPLPNLEFTFSNVTSGPVTVTVPGENLKISGDTSIGLCNTWMSVVDGRGNAGIPFYTAKYMIWNQAKPSLAFADQVN